MLDAYSYEMFPPFNPPYLSNAVEIFFHLASSPHPHLLLPNWRLLPNILNYTVQCSAVLHGGVLRSAVQFSIVQCSALHQCSVVQCSALQQCSAVQCSGGGGCILYDCHQTPVNFSQRHNMKHQTAWPGVSLQFSLLWIPKEI